MHTGKYFNRESTGTCTRFTHLLRQQWGRKGGRLVECESFQASLGTTSIKTLIFSDEELMPQEGTSKAIILQLKINFFFFFLKREQDLLPARKRNLELSSTPVLGYSYHSGSWYVFYIIGSKTYIL